LRQSAYNISIFYNVRGSKCAATCTAVHVLLVISMSF
jgi:hypothetical protein